MIESLTGLPLKSKPVMAAPAKNESWRSLFAKGQPLLVESQLFTVAAITKRGLALRRVVPPVPNGGPI